MNKGLLDEIAEGINSYCLSDLRTIEYSCEVYAAVLELDPSAYPVSEWEMAVGYILSEPKLEFMTQESAKEYLLKRLKD